MMQYTLGPETLNTFKELVKKYDELAEQHDKCWARCHECAQKQGWYGCTPCSKSRWECRERDAFESVHDRLAMAAWNVGSWAMAYKNRIIEAIGVHNEKIEELNKNKN